MTCPTGLTLSHRILQAYALHCKALCLKMGLPQTAFDILMFIANNPQCNTARDITEIRGIKANLASLNIDKLVREGYLLRRAAPDDRRKVLLICTQKADPIICQGRAVQKAFMERLFSGVSGAEYEQLVHTMDILAANLNKMTEA